MDIALPEGSPFAGRYRVDHLIGKGLIHRDISATHIWLDERGEAHLGDFDRAMSPDEPPPDHGGPAAAEGYPAPELLNDAPDARADLYSLGGVLYELLTGREPVL